MGTPNQREPRASRRTPAISQSVSGRRAKACGSRTRATRLPVAASGAVQPRLSQNASLPRVGSRAARGTEPNIRKQESARAPGLDVGFFDLDSHPERYDALSLLNVYSHLPDPPNFLSSLARILNPRGWLLLQTGDSAHLSPREHYRPFGLPDHLSFASEAIIRGLLDRCGFRVTGIIKYPRDTLGSAKVWKEVVKLAIPGYRSKIPDAIPYRGPKYLTDMYVLARPSG